MKIQHTPIFAAFLCTILIVLLLFFLQRYNRSLIFRVESTILEQKVEIRKQVEEQRLLYATLYSVIPELSSLNNYIYLRLHDDMCYNCYATIIKELFKLEKQYSFQLKAIGAYHYYATFSQTLDDLDWNDRPGSNDLLERDKIPADEALCPYIFTIDSNGKIDNILFLSKNIPTNTILTFFESVMRKHTNKS